MARRIAGCVLLCLGCAEDPELDLDSIELLQASGEEPRVVGFDADGRSRLVLHEGDDAFCSPRWSPDGRYFTVETCLEDDETILVSYPDRSLMEVLGRDLVARWSPTRGTLIFGDGTELDPDTMESDVLDVPGGPRTWSPASDAFALVQSEAVVIYDVAGDATIASIPREVEFDWGTSVPDLSDLAWSPQGDTLLARAGLRMLFVLRPDTETLEPWVLPDWTDNDLVYGADWGPDGRIAVARYGPGGQRVEIYDAPFAPVVDRIDGATAPLWSGDGRLAVLVGDELQVFTPDLARVWRRRVEEPQATAWRP